MTVALCLGMYIWLNPQRVVRNTMEIQELEMEIYKLTYQNLVAGCIIECLEVPAYFNWDRYKCEKQCTLLKTTTTTPAL